MSREGIIELACLYGPLLGSALLAAWCRPSRRFAIGLLFALAWNLALLPWLDGIARAAGLWEFHSGSPALGGMPLALYFGWCIAWGVLAPLLSAALGERPWTTIALLVALDFRAMPEMEPVLVLQPRWWIGEIVVVAVLLLPSVSLARRTTARTHLGLRCAMLAPAFGGIFLGLPLLVLGGGLPGILALWQALPGVGRPLLAVSSFLLALPGLTALRDLALSGGGTPVPLDPPQRLVTHGIYAYVRNPMQVSMTLLLMMEAVLLGSCWPLVLAVLGIVYSEGLARWSENQDMRDRFGEKWQDYHSAVRAWWPRWQPAVGEPCELWLDEACGPCAEISAWFARKQPPGLQLRNAANWPGPAPLQRVTWHHPASGRRECGIAGIAMALQHLALPYAVLGWIAGLPGFSHVLQACFDAAGAGKRAA
ncbi:methyltransferase [Haloferula sp. BvORR071]|uniref:methyltransferase family protein n=1 Tax=Haloferula sp. BvORR071 TaxID=1396141 RepID=UPI000698CEAB|nr:methyltransferase [Haloferula sp. BvORR071]